MTTLPNAGRAGDCGTAWAIAVLSRSFDTSAAGNSVASAAASVDFPAPGSPLTTTNASAIGSWCRTEAWSAMAAV